MAEILKATKDKILECEKELNYSTDTSMKNLEALFQVREVNDLTEEQAQNYLKRLEKALAKKGVKNALVENAKNNTKIKAKVDGKAIVSTTPATPVANKKETWKDLLTEEISLQTKILPKDFNKERFVDNCIRAMSDPQKNKINWNELDKRDVIRCLIDGAKYDCQYGKEFYIIPFYNKNLGKKVATIMFDYKGLLRAITLFSYRTIKNIITSVVYEGDEFVVSPLTHPPIKHIMKFATNDTDKITFAYCFIEYQDGGYDFEVMNREQLNQVQFSTKKEVSNFWRDWYSEMARKSAIRRLSKRIVLNFPNADIEKVWQDDLERDNAYNPNEAEQQEHEVIDVMGVENV